MYSHYDYIEEDQNAYLFKVRYFVEKVPLFSRFIIASVILFYLFTWLNYHFADMLSDIPYFVVKDFELISSPFVHCSFFQMMLSLYFVIPMIIDREKKTGTIEFIYDFFLKNLMIQLLFFFVMMAFGLFNLSFLRQVSSGLLNYYILNITVKGFAFPNEMTNFLCFPYKIKVKFYLIFIVILMNLLFHWQADVFVAVFLGYLEVFCYRTTFQLSRNKILDLETNEFLLFLTNLPNFVSYLESQANLHIIDVISLNPETAGNVDFEMAGVKQEDRNEEMKGPEPKKNDHEEILLDENLNGEDHVIIGDSSKSIKNISK